jgi:uncharacterized membrane protein YedE/YeeE
MLVVGIFAGSALGAGLSHDRTTVVISPLWQWRFRPSIGRRLTGAFFGGALMLIGARLAKGCTSGHGISGTLQLAGRNRKRTAKSIIAWSAPTEASCGISLCPI